jgi:hypothetical protein
MEWNSPKTGVFDDSVNRTRALANAMAVADITSVETELNTCGNVIKYGRFSNEVGDIINHAVATLNAFPKMLKYKFSNDDSLEKIEVHSHVDLFKQFSDKEKMNICPNACIVHAAIELFLDNHTFSPYVQKPYVRLTSKLSDKCRYGAPGGSKSKHRRRRHSRRKLRAKTHKRRRH